MDAIHDSEVLANLATTDTTFSFTIREGLDRFLAVAPVANQTEWGRTNRPLVNVETSCYIQGFYLERPFSNKSCQPVVLNSNYNLRTLCIEHKTGNELFKEVFSTDTFSGLNFNYIDRTQERGKNTYRAKVLTNDGRNMFWKQMHRL